MTRRLGLILVTICVCFAGVVAASMASAYVGPPDSGGFYAHCEVLLAKNAFGGASYPVSCEYGPVTAHVRGISFTTSAGLRTFGYGSAGDGFTSYEPYMTPIDRGGVFELVWGGIYLPLTSGDPSGAGVTITGCSIDLDGVGTAEPCNVDGYGDGTAAQAPLPNDAYPGGTPGPGDTEFPNAAEKRAGCACADPVDMASGNYYETITDLSIPGRSPALDETRTYGSLNASYNGPFGFGWASSYDTHLQLGSGSPPSTVTVVQENAATVSFTWNGAAYEAPPWVLATLVLNGDGTYTFTRQAQEQFVFDATGLLLKEIARDGWAGSPGTGVPAAYTTTLAYSSGRVSIVTDAAGRTLTFGYGTSGKVSSVVDSTGRSVSYGYDGSGNLTDVTDALSGNTHFTYDTNHLLLTVRDPRGNTVVTNTYDGTGRTLTQTDALSRETIFDYTSIPGATKLTDPKGNVVVDGFTNGMLTSVTKGYGTTSAETWSYTYDLATLGVATMTDPNAHVTSYTWDLSGHPLTASDALNRPGKLGGSLPWKRGWSYARRQDTGEADHTSVFRSGEAAGDPVGPAAPR